jgi:histidinol-phosphate aminotransferase
VGIRDYYKQFEAVPVEEVAAGLREQAAERRRHALARVEPLDLSVTTWPEFPPHSVVNAITYAARRGLHRYLDPHGGELRGELAHGLGLPEERIVVGDGIAQLMTAAAHVLLEPGDELVTPWPGYPLHPIIARAARGHAVPVPGFGVDELLRAVNDRTRVVALANPNDPTGELLSIAELQRLLTALPERVVVLLDEALRDFVTAEPVNAVLELLETHPRLLLFRTFSKAWGIAGLRCGYAIGGEGSETLLEQLEPELGFNELALAGALEAVRHHPDLATRRAATIAAHRERLLAELAERDVVVAPSHANVLWLTTPGVPGGDLLARLARGGITVRGGGVLGDPERVRITVPHLAHDVDRLLRALDAALADA